MVPSLATEMLVIIALGLLLLAMIVVQMLLGYRKLKFKGRLHWTVHKWVAWGVLGVGLVHGVYALMYLGVLPGLR